MPRIDTYTARPVEGRVNVGPISPESFGSQLGESVSTFGQTLRTVSNHLQQQRDEIDLVDRAADFDQQMAKKYQDILNDDSLRGETVEETMTNRTNALKRFAKEQNDTLGVTTTREVSDADGNISYKEITPPSGAVQRALQKHIIRRSSSHLIEMQSDALKAEANQQARDLEQTINQQVDLAVLQPWNEGEHLGEMAVMLGRARGNKIIPPETVDKMAAAAHDRFWRQTASTTPARIMQIQAEYLSQGKAPANMDQSKIMEYGNIAVGRLNAKDKQEQADIKELQEKNQARLTAQAIRGGMDRSDLADIVDRRGVDPDKAMSLINLNDAIKQKQKEENFIDGRTPQLETRIFKLKYDPKTTPETIEAFRQQIFDERIKDHISQRDFEHLDSQLMSANEWLHQQNNTGQGAAISHAKEVLTTNLAVTGPMGFDSLGNQVKGSAELDFYRELERDPKANPMDVAEKVIKRYKPIIEQRIKLGETDQSKLDTAKMEGLAKRGAISKAALNEWKSNEEQRKGRKIVEDTQRDLPPPAEPTWFDTIMDKFKSGSPKSEAPKSESAKPKMRK